MLALRRLVPASRSLHTTASAMRKAKAPAQEHDMDEDLDADELFDDSYEGVAAGSGERAVLRGEIVQRIMHPSHSRSEHRAGHLRKVIQLSDTPEELEDFARVLRQWRVNGYRVSKQTSTEIIGRCINLGRPDLAEKYYANKAQYGLTNVSDYMAGKLKTKLAEQGTSA